jgi:hypothetical protein
MVRAPARTGGCGNIWAAGHAPGDKGEAEGVREARLGPSRRPVLLRLPRCTHSTGAGSFDGVDMSAQA